MKLFSRAYLPLLIGIFFISLGFASFTVSENVYAEDTGCPSGQHTGASLKDEYAVGGKVDKNKCYRNCKPNGSAFFDCKEAGDISAPKRQFQCLPGYSRGTIEKGLDRDKCYDDKLCPNGINVTGGGGSCGDEYPDDGLECPQGMYRGVGSPKLQGGYQGSRLDPSKCYKCDNDGCEEAGIYAMPKGIEICNYTGTGKSIAVDPKCKKKGQDESKAYMEMLKKAAPTKDYNFFTHHIPGTTIANTFCDYYDTQEEDRYDYRFIRQACIIGYELGFGQNQICTDRYLGIVPPKPYGDFPSDYAFNLFYYIANLKSYDNPINRGNSPADSSSNVASLEYVPGKYKILTDNFAKKYKQDLVGSVIAACHDGFTQYKVDYNFCEGTVIPYLPDESCKQKLRTDSRNVFDPGPIDERKTTKPGQQSSNQVILNTRAATGLNCGGILTAYFSCGGGNTIETSGIWNLITIILNILIALVGILAVGGIVWGGLRYASSQDNSGEQQAAREFIRNVIIGLVLFVAMWAIMQYIIPGGVFQ